MGCHDATDPIEAMARQTYEAVRHWLARRSGVPLGPWEAEDKWLKDVFRQAQRDASYHGARGSGNGRKQPDSYNRNGGINGRGHAPADRTAAAAAAIARYY